MLLRMTNRSRRHTPRQGSSCLEEAAEENHAPPAHTPCLLRRGEIDARMSGIVFRGRIYDYKRPVLSVFEQCWNFTGKIIRYESILFINFVPRFTARKIGVGARPVKSQIDVNPVFFPQKIHFPIISQPHIGLGNRIQRKFADERFRVPKRLRRRPRCAGPALLLGRIFKLLQLREQLPIQFANSSRAESRLRLRSHRGLPFASSPWMRSP